MIGFALGAALFGILTACLTKHDEMIRTPALFDTDIVLRTSGFAVAVAALIATTTLPDPAFGLFSVILLIPFMLPFGLRNLTRWRAHTGLVLLACAANLTGLFTA